MRVRLLAIVLLLLFGIAVADAQRGGGDTTRLPVRRVVLYKSGVGYFEHLGSVTGSADVSIPFTTGQLNDALNTLTALDLDGGSITNINYNSVAPLEQRLGALGLPLGTRADPLQFYNALRGARLDVRSGTSSTSGRLLAVERKTRARGTTSESVDELTLVTDDGSVRVVALGPDTTVHVADGDLRDDVASYLAIVGSARDDTRRLVISTTGSGTRRLFVSYISEVPVWKSTYRLVLQDGSEKPVLQGWAVVDNTLGQDWTNVELSLVAGAPQSFVQPISQPYYARRAVVPLPQTALLRPQTHAPTLESGPGVVEGSVHDESGAALPGTTVSLVDRSGRTVASTTTDGSGRYTFSADGGAYTLSAQLPGFATVRRALSVDGGSTVRADVTLAVTSISETVTVSAETPTPPPPPPAPLQRKADLASRGGVVGGVAGGLPEAPELVRRAAQTTAQATAQDLGDLFEYTLEAPVTIRKNQSALVPILNTRVDAERVSLWSQGAGSGRPLLALWLTNASDLTLDGGSFSVIDHNAFAGEGLVDPIKPGEKRLLSYGADLAVLVSGSRSDRPTHVSRVVAHDGILMSTEEDRATWTYRIRNADTSARTLVIEHPVRNGWDLDKDPAPAESSPGAARYRIRVNAKQESTLQVHERRTGETRYALAGIDDRTIVLLAQRGADEPSLRRALQPLLAKRQEVAAANARLAAINDEIASIGHDQERVRENMKALRGSSEEKALLQRYTRELNDQEDRLESLRGDQQKATAERNARSAELSELARQIAFEIGG